MSFRFAAFLFLAAAALTARAQTPPSPGDLQSALEELQSTIGDLGSELGDLGLEGLFGAIGGVAECTAAASTSCPEISNVSTDDSGNSGYPESEAQFEALCGDECKAAIADLGECLQPVLDSVSSLDTTQPGGQDALEVQMNQLQSLGPLIEETCSTCAWDDTACFDRIQEKHSAGDDLAANPQAPGPSAGDDSRGAAFAAPLGMMLLASFAYLLA